MKKGDGEIPGLTDNTQPRRLGPKRVGKIRKLFNLSKEDDVRQYVVHRPLPEKDGKKPRSKAPKIQRLVTPARIQVIMACYDSINGTVIKYWECIPLLLLLLTWFSLY